MKDSEKADNLEVSDDEIEVWKYPEAKDKNKTWFWHFYLDGSYGGAERTRKKAISAVLYYWKHSKTSIMTDSEKLRRLASLIDFIEQHMDEVQNDHSLGRRVKYISQTIMSEIWKHKDLRRIADNLEATQPLIERQEKAFETFKKVCETPMPDTEYDYAMIKMMAFLAGRVFEFEKRTDNLEVSDEEIKRAAPTCPDVGLEDILAHNWFTAGAGWMRDKMQGR